jgi:hypothetical protein
MLHGVGIYAIWYTALKNLACSSLVNASSGSSLKTLSFDHKTPVINVNTELM